MHFPAPPLHPPEGEFPPATPSGGRQAARQGIPLLQPCHAACIFPSALGQGRRRPFPLPQGPAPPLLILARCFLSRPQVYFFPAGFDPSHRPPSRRRRCTSPLVVCRPFVSLICDVGGERCSRRGRAAASLPTGLVHRLPRRSPRPSLAVAIVRRGRAALRPAPPLTAACHRTRPPQRGSLPASGAGLTTAARRQARPSGIWYFSFARSRQTSLCSDCRSSGVAAGSATA